VKDKNNGKKNGQQSSVPNSQGSIKGEKKKVEQTKEKEQQHTCGECRWYDHSTEREFHRDGIRKGLVETRAICRSERSTARQHLVKKESVRPCFEAGVYVKPAEEKSTKKHKKDTEEQKEQKEEHVEETPTQKTQRKKHIRPKPGVASATNPLNGEKKLLETTNSGKVYVKET
jgi:hypothetical protein